MRGDGWVRCCICGELHTPPYESLAIQQGDKYDVCTGLCAAEAGLSDD